MSNIKRPRRLPRNIHQLARAFEKETDRAAALLAFSYLEAVLERVLRTWLVCEDKGVVERLVGPGRFSNMAALVYALGLTGSEGYRDLITMSEVRNFFAHHVLDADSFDDPEVKTKCQGLLTLATLTSGEEGKAVFGSCSAREGFLWAAWAQAQWISELALRPTKPHQHRGRAMFLSFLRALEPLGYVGLIRRLGPRQVLQGKLRRIRAALDRLE